jgi:hypothetical protein
MDILGTVFKWLFGEAKPKPKPRNYAFLKRKHCQKCGSFMGETCRKCNHAPEQPAQADPAGAGTSTPPTQQV